MVVGVVFRPSCYSEYKTDGSVAVRGCVRTNQNIQSVHFNNNDQWFLDIYTDQYCNAGKTTISGTVCAGTTAAWRSYRVHH